MLLKNLSKRVQFIFQSNQDVDQSIFWHSVLSFVFRGGSILANLIMVPLALESLNRESYGVWLAIGAMITWFNFLDVGLGNGLRNRGAEALAANDFARIRTLVSTSFWSIAILILIFILAVIAIFPFIAWDQLFNTRTIAAEELSDVLLCVAITFLLGVVLRLTTSLYLAFQIHSIQSIINFLTQVGSLIGVFYLVKIEEHSLLHFAYVVTLIPLIVQMGVTLYAFSTRFKDFLPHWKYFERGELNNVLGLGLRFVLVQLTWMLITTTDSYLISVWMSPEKVVDYTVSWKYFGIINIGFVLLMTPYWSAYTQAYAKKDMDWIIQANKRINRYVLIFTVIEIAMFFLAPFVIDFWISGKIKIPNQIHLALSVFAWLYMFLGSKNYFLNGIGKLGVQMRILIVTAILHIPMSYFFCVTLEGGISGLVWGTNICILLNILVSSIQVEKILNQSAQGFWDK
jgi:O-antigen/teichoic acid export membrane protein